MNPSIIAKVLQDLISKIPALGYTVPVGLIGGGFFYELTERGSVGGSSCAPNLFGICLSVEWCVAIGGIIGVVAGAAIWLVSAVKAGPS